nr:hypothetical protein [Tanacetum cinerariifolium]
MLEIIPVTEFKVEALQVKYPFIDWEIYSKRSRSYWKIIRVSGITQVYQSFKDMLKYFDREDLDVLWRLVKDKFSSAVPTVDKEKALWVKLKRLFEPDANDVISKLQRYMHYPIMRKVIVTEDTVRQALRLNDAKSIDCLPNEEIFTELERMGYKMPSTKLTFCKAFFLAQWEFLIHTILQCMSAKRIAWNEFSSSMASALFKVLHVSKISTTDDKCSSCVECLPTEEIFVELARMGYEKTPLKLTLYKAFFSAQWKFLIYILVQCVSAKRTSWNEFSCSMASVVICFAIVLINNQVDDLFSHTTKYSSPALTQKVFANMRRIGKGFSGVETPLFATMLVQPQSAVEDEDDEDEVPTTPTPPSPTYEPSPPPHEPITTPPQAHPASPSPPPQEQPTTTSASDMTLLNTLMETCTTLSHKFAALEQDKVAQALEIFKLERRKLLWVLRRMHPNKGERIEAIDADEDITLVDMETEVDLDAEF